MNATHFNFTTPIGMLKFSIQDNRIYRITFLASGITNEAVESSLYNSIKHGLEDYFSSKTKPLSLPYHLQGTPFQERVWHALSDIPYGSTKTYGEIANQLKSSPRAVGNACRNNPLPFIIPCHRVIAANSVGGFAGKTHGKYLAIKQWLIQHEQIN